MSDPGTIHCFAGDDPARDTKTSCGLKLEALPRREAAVAWKLRASTTCKECRTVIERVERMCP